MSKTTTEYVEIPESAVPASTRFDVPRSEQGQTVEYAYGDYPQGRGENGPGDVYERVTNKSIPHGRPGRVRYYRRVGKAG